MTAATLALGACASASPPPPVDASPSPTSVVGPSTSGAGSLAPAASDSAVPAESAPPGDIPDNLAFVQYANTAGRFTFTHPEGWVESERGTTVSFTDKLNGVTVVSEATDQVPTVATARSTEVARLRTSVQAFELRDISTATVPAGEAVVITYRQNSAADPITGKVYRDEVQEYLVQSSGRLVRMDLFGPVGADNVDAYRTMIQSLAVQ